MIQSTLFEIINCRLDVTLLVGGLNDYLVRAVFLRVLAVGLFACAMASHDWVVVGSSKLSVSVGFLVKEV